MGGGGKSYRRKELPEWADPEKSTSGLICQAWCVWPAFFFILARWAGWGAWVILEEGGFINYRELLMVLQRSSDPQLLFMLCQM